MNFLRTLRVSANQVPQCGEPDCFSMAGESGYCHPHAQRAVLRLMEALEREHARDADKERIEALKQRVVELLLIAGDKAEHKICSFCRLHPVRFGRGTKCQQCWNYQRHERLSNVELRMVRA